MTETHIELNVHEIGILLSALENLNASDENLIAKEYGSSRALEFRLKDIWEQMDQSQLHIQFDYD
jgi:hypothetical protein